MSIFRSTKGQAKERPSLLIQLKLVQKQGQPLDPSEAWQELLIAFKGHPTLEVFQARVAPDKESDSE